MAVSWAATLFILSALVSVLRKQLFGNEVKETKTAERREGGAQ
jgi:hypothetical protein